MLLRDTLEQIDISRILISKYPDVSGTVHVHLRVLTSPVLDFPAGTDHTRHQGRNQKGKDCQFDWC